MMTDWLTEDTPHRRPFLSPFAKKATGSSKSTEEDDDDDDSEDDDDDDEDDDDPDDDLSDEELRAELKATREKLSRASGQAARRRKQVREERRKAANEKGKMPAAKADDDKIDVEAVREEARREGESAGTTRAKRAEARAALVAAGVPAERVGRALGMLDLDDLELDDDGLDGIDDAIDDLKKDVPEFFPTKRKRRESVAGGGKGDETPRTKKMSASERQAAQLTGGVRR